MAYWWVSQGKTYAAESVGQYLWAPGAESANLYHWSAMDDVRTGDIIFSYVNQAITAVITARGTVEAAERPPGHKVEAWQGVGRRIQAEYATLPSRISLSTLGGDTLEALAVFHGPLNKNHTGNQGYLFSVSDIAARGILAVIDSTNPPLLVEATVENAAPNPDRP
jgi:hypothetical protein